MYNDNEKKTSHLSGIMSRPTTIHKMISTGDQSRYC